MRDAASCKRVYWFVLPLCAVALCVLVAAISLVLARPELHLPRELGGLIPPLIVLSVPLAGAICRRLGFDRGGRASETLRSSAEAPQVLPAMELRIPRAYWILMGSMCGGFCLFVLLMLRFVPSVPGSEIYGYAAAAGAGLIALICCLALARNWGLLVVADGDGIATTDPLHTVRVPWNRMAACDLVTIRDVCGDLRQVIVVFRDDRGSCLLRLHHARLLESSTELERFLALLRARFSAS